jgi:hypothetical protein
VGLFTGKGRRMHIGDTTIAFGHQLRRSMFRTCSVIALSLGSVSMAMAAGPVPQLSAAQQLNYLSTHPLQTSKWTPKLLNGGPHHNSNFHPNFSGPSGLGTTVPYWTTNITSPLDNNTYTLSMVGSSPYAPTPSNTNVTYAPVVLRIHLDGFTFDPSQPSPSYGGTQASCDTQSPSRRFFNSPLFRPTTFTSNGVNVSAVPGGTQLISAFQRANFWSAVHGTNYGVTLIPSRLTPIIVDWYPTNPLDFVAGVPDNCGGEAAIAIVNINEYNDELLAIAAAYSNPAQIPVTLGNDVAIYVGNSTSNCCVLGYHNAVPVPGGVQVYATGAYYDTNHVFGPSFADITVWSHELSELIDDPFVQSIAGAPGGFANALTPPWGHTGQVSGCQNNLETGDPLSPGEIGNYPNFPVTGDGGFVYHFQDMAFHDWFYRTPSSSTGGRYSFMGIFVSVQGVCH